MHKSIFIKYISAFMAIIVISFLILLLITVGVVNAQAAEAKRAVLKNVANGASAFLEARTESLTKTNFTEMIKGSEEDIDRMLAALAATDKDVSILLIDNHRKVVRLVTPTLVPQASDAEIPLAVMSELENDATAAEWSEIDAIEGIFDSPHYVHMHPVYTADGYRCGVIFACTESDVQSDLLAVMLKTMIEGSLWIILVALVAVYVVTDRVIGPLKSMSLRAKEFANGNFDARVPVTGHDEVSRLAEAFNEMADSLSRLETMRNTFIANVSHDLRTPMTTISGFIDNILSGAIPPERQSEYLGMIRAEVGRLARLVTSLLDLSRIQAGERKFVFRTFDVCEMARTILFSFENKIDAKKLDIEFLCDEDRLLVRADHDAIYQVLYNLIDNAVKFSKEQGVLRVSFEVTKENKVLVSVYNEGDGISPENLPYVFEQFYKADKSRGLDKSGAGLGLFISKTIIDAHHEKIFVKSERDQYCEFAFTLSLLG